MVLHILAGFNGQNCANLLNDHVISLYCSHSDLNSDKKLDSDESTDDLGDGLQRSVRMMRE